MCSLFCVALPLRHAGHAVKKEYRLLNKREVPVESCPSRPTAPGRSATVNPVPMLLAVDGPTFPCAGLLRCAPTLALAFLCQSVKYRKNRRVHINRLEGYAQSNQPLNNVRRVARQVSEERDGAKLLVQRQRSKGRKYCRAPMRHLTINFGDSPTMQQPAIDRKHTCQNKE